MPEATAWPIATGSTRTAPISESLNQAREERRSHFCETLKESLFMNAALLIDINDPTNTQLKELYFSQVLSFVCILVFFI